MDIDPRSGLEILDEETSWALLRDEPVGRLVALVDGRPEVWPVNFAVSDGAIFVRTADDSRLASIAGQDVVFEVDSLSVQFRMGWSVIVHGRVAELADPVEIGRAELLQLRAWSLAGKPTWLQLVPARIDGRRTAPTGGEIRD